MSEHESEALAPLDPHEALASKEKYDDFADLLTNSKKVRVAMAAVLPKHLTPERILKVAVAVWSRSPDLQKCTVPSLYACLMEGAELGLELGRTCHFVPFKNKDTKRLEATFIADWRGLVELARRHGDVSSIRPRVVRERDSFVVQYGLEERLEHTPSLDANPGDLVFTYAVARDREGNVLDFEVMSRVEVDAIAAKAKSAAWRTDFEEMAKKTVIRRLCKRLPQSPELAAALAAEDRLSAAEFTDTVDAQVFAPPAQEGARTPSGALYSSLTTEEAVSHWQALLEAAGTVDEARAIGVELAAAEEEGGDVRKVVDPVFAARIRDLVSGGTDSPPARPTRRRSK